MTVKYLDPYKDDPYGKLRGDKAEAYVKITFDEAKVYSEDNAYWIAAYVTSYTGVVRNYKPNEMLMPGLCAIPVYGAEYEIRQKDVNGQWEGVKHQPSIYEKALYDYISQNEALFVTEGKVISGELSFMPNGMVASIDATALFGMVRSNSQITVTEPTGKLPPYTPPSAGNYKKSSGYSRGVSSEDKIAFLKKQMVADVRDTALKEEHTFISIVKQIIDENPTDERFLDTYFELLMATIR